VRHAAGGTLFLDEIGDLPAEGQRSLLRFLQEGTVRPVGAYEEVAVDVRVVAATHVQLSEAVARGEFREDLYYRLNVLRIHLPPVRERQDDARLLLGHFIKRSAPRYRREAPVVSEEFWQALRGQPLPGNVRQLQSLAERIVVSDRRRPLRVADLSRLMDAPPSRHPPRIAPPTEHAARAPRRSRGSYGAPGASDAHASGHLERHAAPSAPAIDLSAPLGDNVALAVRSVERAYLVEALVRTHGRIADAAILAGISRRTLHRKLLELGIDKSEFRLRSSDPPE
jgi:DNA-binding NtrC family response regulator